MILKVINIFKYILNFILELLMKSFLMGASKKDDKLMIRLKSKKILYKTD